MKEFVPIFFDWPEVTGELNAEEKGRLIDAIVIYAQGGDWQGKIQGNERFLFPAFRKQVDRSREISEVRAEAGRNKPKQIPTNHSKQEQTGANANKPKQTAAKSAKANEEEKEKEEEKEEEKEKEEDNIAAAAYAREGSYRHSEIGTLVSTCLKAMTPRAWDELRDYLEEMPQDLVAWAVQDACEHGGNNWAYVSRVLAGLSEAGIRTVEEAEKRNEDFRAMKTGRSPKPTTQNSYEQRQYEERKPDELPQWIRDMVDRGEAAV